MLYLVIFVNVIHHRTSTPVNNVEVMTILKQYCSDITKPATMRRAILLLADKVNFSWFFMNMSLSSCSSCTVLRASWGGSPPSVALPDSISCARTIWNKGSYIRLSHLAITQLVLVSISTGILVRYFKYRSTASAFHLTLGWSWQYGQTILFGDPSW